MLIDNLNSISPKGTAMEFIALKREVYHQENGRTWESGNMEGKVGIWR